MSELIFAERPAAGEPSGLLVLHHGRGTNEQDLLGLADVLDPERRLHVATPRGPLTLPGWPGHHWYVVPRVGYPEPATFPHASRRLARIPDAPGTPARLPGGRWPPPPLPPRRPALGGFRVVAVMSSSLGVGTDPPPVAGILAFSGF